MTIAASSSIFANGYFITSLLNISANRLESLYPQIRQKFGAALLNWHPSDPSAKVILEPWIKVFSKGTMEAFLLRTIYPKLEQCIIDFQINPHQQDLRKLLQFTFKISIVYYPIVCDLIYTLTIHCLSKGGKIQEGVGDFILRIP